MEVTSGRAPCPSVAHGVRVLHHVHVLRVLTLLVEVVHRSGRQQTLQLLQHHTTYVFKNYSGHLTFLTLFEQSNLLPTNYKTCRGLKNIFVRWRKSPKLILSHFLILRSTDKDEQDGNV